MIRCIVLIRSFCFEWYGLVKPQYGDSVQDGLGYRSLGGFAPQTPHQGGSAPLDPPKYGQVPPQDGLVTPPLWRLRADLLRNARNL